MLGPLAAVEASVARIHKPTSRDWSVPGCGGSCPCPLAEHNRSKSHQPISGSQVMHDRRCGEHSRPCPESESVHTHSDNKTRQADAEESWRQTFKLTRKLPYGLSYEFEDANGRSSRSSIGRSARSTGTAAAAPVVTRKRSPTSARSTCISSARPICTSSSAPQQFHFVAQPLGDHRRLPGAASNRSRSCSSHPPSAKPACDPNWWRM